ncbi:hypothetical protein HDV05_004499 [Chytridiales sp. JEL 0842]|nr:hypothetical protein HDV05_004499 [Chytridiales sp. JEL 0842]
MHSISARTIRFVTQQIRSAVPHLSRTLQPLPKPSTPLFTFASSTTGPRSFSTESSALDKSRKLFEQGLHRWNNGDLEGAKDAYQESIEVMPTADGYYNLGNCLYALEKGEEALSSWQKSIQLDPTLTEAHVNLANLLALSFKKPNEALKHYKAALDLNPSDGQVQYNYGVVLDSMGKLEEAVEMYEGAVRNGIENAQKNLRNAKARLLGRKMEEAERKGRKVRAVAAASDDTVFTSSRDTRVFQWNRTSTNTFALDKNFLGHSHFVNTLVYLKPTPEFPGGLIASGSSDKTINVFDVSNPGEPVFSLVGHTDTVCALAQTSDGLVVSGSWDKTARVWKDWQCEYTLTGHTQSVWAVVGIREYILTGSADKLIKVWQGGKCVKTLTGHTDAVRALAEIPGQGFLSASNDSTLRVWNYDGDCLRELSAHTSFVYSVCILPSGEYASCGEDRSLRVWNGSECIQTILLPCNSVWGVTSLPNGDLVTAGSDGVARVFTRSQDRVADEMQMKEFEGELAKFAIPSNQVGDVDKSKLPGLEALEQPGKPSQVIMVRNGNNVEAHQFDAATQQWTKVGDVVDAIGQKRNQSYNGQTYDYVFDVDIGDGQMLKLPYNTSENPYQTAQEFIYRHELPQDYLDHIANFITTNVGGNVAPQPAAASDPWSGSGRYVPGGASAPSGLAPRPAASSGPSDPWSGGGRYVPGGASAAAPPSASGPSLIPQRQYTFFKAINVKAVRTKVGQLSTAFGTDANALTAEESTLLDQVCALIETPAGFSKAFSEKHAAVVEKIAFSWPAAQRFPGIDILRASVPHTAIPFKGKEEDFFNQLLFAMGITDTANASDVNKMLGLRLIANLFGTSEGQGLVHDQMHNIANLIKSSGVSGNANLKLALVTVALNFIVLMKAKNVEVFHLDLLSWLIELLKSDIDVETEVRGVVAAGTLIHGSEICKAAAQQLHINNVISVSKNSADVRVSAAQAELKRLLV